MIVVVANNDLELLALRAAVESLPAGFPPVRAHGGVELDADTPAPPLDGVRAAGSGKGKAFGVGSAVRCSGGAHRTSHPVARLRRGGAARRRADRARPRPPGSSPRRPAIGPPAGWSTSPTSYASLPTPSCSRAWPTPADLPSVGLLGPRADDPARPTVAVVTYRANVVAGNTLPVDQLCDAIEARGGANARAVHCYSLRTGRTGRHRRCSTCCATPMSW